MRIIYLIFPALLLVLSACSNEYNWRTIQHSNPHYQIMFPAKPAQHERALVLAGVKLRMHMQAAEAGGFNFAVAQIAIHDPAQANLILAAMRDGMLKNIQGEVLRTERNGVLLVRGRNQQSLPVWMHARFFLHENYAYQLIIIGEKPASPEVLETFMLSFKA